MNHPCLSLGRRPTACVSSPARTLRRRFRAGRRQQHWSRRFPHQRSRHTSRPGGSFPSWLRTEQPRQVIVKIRAVSVLRLVARDRSEAPAP